MKEIELNDKIIKRIYAEDSLDVNTINIGDDVEEISDNAFENFFNLRYVIFSKKSNLRRIGKSAFKNCFNLVSIDLPVCNKLEVIEDEAFSYCSNLVVARLANSVRRIGKEAFYKSGIVECKLSSSLEEIDEMAFSYNKFLRFIVIPSKTRVSDDAFSGNNTEIIQIEEDKIIDMNSIMSNNKPDTIKNKENIILINQEGKILSAPIRDKSFYISSHESGIEYLAGKYLNTFIEDKTMNWLLSNSFATIFMVDSYQDIFDILGFPNDLSTNQIKTIKEILETHKENQIYGVLEIIDGHIKRSCDEDELTAGEFLDDFDRIISKGCRLDYFANIKSTSKVPKK